MAEYIEREAAINGIIKIIRKSDMPEDWSKGMVAAMSTLYRIPAADVREVVLCRDCKYSYDSVGGWCCSHGICVDCIVREYFFCADGERREES